MTGKIKRYIHTKFAVLDKYSGKKDEHMFAEIEVGKTSLHHKKANDIYKAEINLRVAGKSLRAAVKRHDLFAAIDVLKDEVVEQLKHYRDKRKTLTKQGARRAKAMLHAI